MTHVIFTAKPLNLSQLSYEITQALGCPPPPLRMVEGSFVSILDDSLNHHALDALIAAHQADPAWQQPLPPRRGLLQRLLRRP